MVLKRTVKTVFAVCLCLTMICITCVSAFAMTAEDIDFDRTGSITIEMESASGETVTDGQLALYRIASLEKFSNGDAEYIVEEEFADCNVDDLSEAQTAEAYFEWAEDNGIEGTQQDMDSTGTVVFENLSLGAYLVAQTKDSDGYNPVNPFIVTVPNEENDVIVYDIDATPKMSSITAIPSEPVVSNPTVSEPNVSNPSVSDNPTVTANPVVSTEPNNGGKSSGTDGAKTGDIIMWSAVGVAVIACAIGGVAVTTRKRNSDTIK